ncbi:MAG: carbon-nitrogen hydrolase family protein [Thermoanaerobacterales bacterium]|nr:carbon-nitrogen hydrolase family protein [Thermoanaerobacterales bacterium]
MPAFRAAVCQMAVDENKGANLACAREMLREAAGSGCRLAVLPEMFNCPYDHAFFAAFAEEYPQGETTSFLSTAARDTGMTVVGGSIPEKDGERLYNTCYVYGPDGRLLGRHRKLHLFDVELEGMTFRESDTFSPGTETGVFDTPVGRLGVAVCFDVRFPEFLLTQTLMGAEIIVVPAAFNTVTGPAHWELLLRARAVDNQVWVLAASPARRERDRYVSHGHSLVVDPWGRVVADAGTGETVLTVTIDPALTRDIRARLPVLNARRPGLYRLA